MEACSPRNVGRSCAFCGEKGDMSGEHVWPKWVRNVILPDRRGVGGYVWARAAPEGTDEIERVLQRDNLALAQIEVKRVCKVCNTGWMHRIEDEAIPVLRRPIQGDPQTLHSEDVEVAASWAFLKCLVVALATNKGDLVPRTAYRWMMEHKRPPASVAVLMACYGGNRHPLYASAGPVEFDVQLGDREPTKWAAYQLTISVGHLVFQVFGHHIAEQVDLRPTGWKRDVATPLWPLPSEPVRWPPRTPLTDETLFKFGRNL